MLLIDKFLILMLIFNYATIVVHFEHELLYMTAEFYLNSLFLIKFSKF